MATIYEISSTCFKEFGLLVSELSKASNSTYLEQMPQGDVEEAYGRFRIWLGNLGALQRGHASLDYRIRESTIMRTNIVTLLQQMLTNLSESMAVFSGARPPLELMQPEWSSSDDESVGGESNSDADDDVHGGAESKSELKQRLASLLDILSDLYKLSFKLRNPSTKPRSSKAAAYLEIDDETGVELFSEYNKFDRLHVSELIRQLRSSAPEPGDADEFLIERLSSSITARRRQFRYWRRHGNKLAQSYSASEDHAQRIHSSSRQDVIKDPERLLQDAHRIMAQGNLTSSVVSRSIFSGTEATTYDKKLDDLLETQSVISYATTAHDLDGRSASLPAPPLTASKGNGFMCPYCNILCPAKHGTGRAWRSHILSDLQPYVCTYPDCTSQMFSSRRQWLEHEGAVHRKVWRCFEHPSAIFSSPTAYQNHLRTSHSKDYDQRNEVIDVAETYLTDDRTTCPLCSQEVSPGNTFHNHLAFHLESIACFALPRNIQEEEEKDSQDGSDVPQAWSEDSRPSLGSEVLSFSSSQPPDSDKDAHNIGLSGSNPSGALDPAPITQVGLADAESDDELFAVRPKRNDKQRVADDPKSDPSAQAPSADRIHCPAEGCSASFERMNDFSLHMKQHGAPELACEYLDCGKKFYRFEDLKDHVSKEHDIDPEITQRFAAWNTANRLTEGISLTPDPPSATMNPDTSISTFQGTKATGFLKGSLLGVGAWSKARSYLGLQASTGELVVVKEIHFSEESAKKTAEDGRMRMRRELVTQLIDIVSSLYHPNVIQFYQYSLKDNTYSILMEYISGGTLAACVQRYGKLPQTMVANFTKQMLRGLAYLHNEEILHRDLTANKVYLDYNGTCKIGWSFMMERSTNVYGLNETVDRRMGSVIRSEGSNYSGKADIWSLGCIVLELLSGRRPFSKEEIIGAIFKLGQLNQAPPIPEDVVSESDPATLSFIYDCFTIYPAERPTAELLLRAPFVEAGHDFNYTSSDLYERIRQKTSPKSPVSAGEGSTSAVGQLEASSMENAEGASPSHKSKEHPPAFAVGDRVAVAWFTKPPSNLYISSQLYDHPTRTGVYPRVESAGKDVERGKWFVEKELGAGE